MAKHHPSPKSPIRIPATDGPSSRAAFTIEELSAMAFGRSLRSATISTTKA